MQAYASPNKWGRYYVFFVYDCTDPHPEWITIHSTRGPSLDDHVLSAMNTYGIDMIRGGSYCNNILSVPQIVQIRKQLGRKIAKEYHIIVNTYNQPRCARQARCDMCGDKMRKGVCNACAYYSCSRCGEKGHWLMQCPKAVVLARK